MTASTIRHYTNEARDEFFDLNVSGRLLDAHCLGQMAGVEYEHAHSIYAAPSKSTNSALTFKTA